MRIALAALLLLFVSAGAWAQPAALVEQDLLNAINKFRAGQNLAPLKMDPVLSRAARMHSEEMANMGYFDHVSPVQAHAEPEQRVVLCGGGDEFVEENIYQEPGGKIDVGCSKRCLAEWSKSGTHLHNMLVSRRLAGVGIACNKSRVYITVVFGD